MSERGATQRDIEQTIDGGERFPAQFGRQGFRRNIPFGGFWRGKHFSNKQIEAFCVYDTDDWLVITVIVKYY